MIGRLVNEWRELPAAVRNIAAGLTTAAVSGGAAAAGMYALDPAHFNMTELRHLGLAFLAGAVAGVLNWLRSSPWQRPGGAAKTVLFAMLIWPLAGCATAGAFAREAQVVNRQAILANRAAHQAGIVSDAEFKDIALQLNRVSVAGREFTKLLAAGRASFVDAARFLAVLQQVLDNLQAAPYGPRVQNVLRTLERLGQSARRVIGELPAPKGAHR